MALAPADADDAVVASDVAAGAVLGADSGGLGDAAVAAGGARLGVELEATAAGADGCADSLATWDAAAGGGGALVLANAGEAIGFGLATVGGSGTRTAAWRLPE